MVLNETLLANVEALADNENASDATPCPSPFDVVDHMLDYKVYQGTQTTFISGEVSISEKKFVLAGIGGSKKVSFTFEKGNCLQPAIGTCCDHTKIGDIISISYKKI